MSFKIIQAHHTTYLECDPADRVIRNERDILDLVAACGENDAANFLIYESNLSPDFFDLKTRLAGELFQKMANYHLRGAGVISFAKIKSERFKELIFEHNKGNLFRFFEDKAAAEEWLVNG